jgi:metal-responsive CopG/Arc/MetJ family transcriptional regulator
MLACAILVEVLAMEMERVMIQVPQSIKAKLDTLRAGGTSVSGFIRSLLEREFQARRDE